MTREDIVYEIQSAIDNENGTRGGVVLDITTAKAALDVIAKDCGVSKWLIEPESVVACSRCGQTGKAGMNYCGYCGAKTTGFALTRLK